MRLAGLCRATAPSASCGRIRCLARLLRRARSAAWTRERWRPSRALRSDSGHRAVARSPCFHRVPPALLARRREFGGGRESRGAGSVRHRVRLAVDRARLRLGPLPGCVAGRRCGAASGRKTTGRNSSAVGLASASRRLVCSDLDARVWDSRRARLCHRQFVVASRVTRPIHLALPRCPVATSSPFQLVRVSTSRATT